MAIQEVSIQTKYKVYTDDSHLNLVDQELIKKARSVASNAYAPYSGFKVGAVALMEDGTFISGTNQENASYPIGLCAERVLLAAASSIAMNQKILTMAISYQTNLVNSDKPVAPCGICRQSLVEFESRFETPLRLLLSGSSGEVFEISSVSQLLPFSFKSENLGK
jgi:cytidine deaminase